MDNQENSPKFSLDKASLEKIAVGAAVAVGGALLTYLTQIVAQVDFGDYTPFVVAGSSILVNTVRKFLTDYTQRYN